MIRKAVLPVAGFGTRCLPASKAIPKEMITVVDRPVIQHVVEEAVAAGIREIVLVTSTAKSAIENHFDTHAELEASLLAKGKHDLLESIRDIVPGDVNIISIRQGKPLGLGHAVLCARPIIGDDTPFAVLLPDVLVRPRALNGALNQDGSNDLSAMLKAFDHSGHAQLMVEQVPDEDVSRYGIVAPDHQAGSKRTGPTDILSAEGDDTRPPLNPQHRSLPICGVVEKPAADQAPSRLAVIGRYALPGEIFSLLANTAPGAGNEIQLTDAIDALIQKARVDAYLMQGFTHDCGHPLGYMEATLAYGLEHPDYGAAFKALLERYQSGA